MSAKRKASRSKKASQAVRRRYTWHLHPPFKNRFDRSQWWEGERDIEPGAALYELARRHPLVRETWVRNFAAATRERRSVAIWIPGTSQRWTDKIMRGESGAAVSPSLYWTCLFGLNSWAKLDYTDRLNWKSCVGNLKGLDFRDESLQCKGIKKFAHWKIIDERQDGLRKKEKIKDFATKENLKMLHNDLAANPPTVEEWETAIAHRAIEAYRQGYVLLAIAPDLPANKAAAVAAAKYKEHLSLYPPGKSPQRARWRDWLPIIAEFEDAETSRDKAKSQVFARYRRTLDGIGFA